MDVTFSEIVQTLVAYAGPLDDPRVGWTGRTPSHPDLFQCERCKAEHLDSSKIPHKEGCTAAALLAVLSRLRSE